jgi:hypothetical protein
VFAVMMVMVVQVDVHINDVYMTMFTNKIY